MPKARLTVTRSISIDPEFDGDYILDLLTGDGLAANPSSEDPHAEDDQESFDDLGVDEGHDGGEEDEEFDPEG